MTASHHWAGALALALVFAGSANAALAPASQASQLSQVQTALGGLSIPFEANSGQWDAQVAYKAQTFAGQVFVTREGRIVYSLPGPVQEKASIQDKAQPQAKTQPVTRAPGWSLVETLVGAQPLAPSASQAAPTHISRFQGNSTYQAATYHSVQLGQAWPGVAVELTAHGNNVEKLFHVAPGADAGQIQVQLQGAKTLRLGEQGQLIAQTGHGDVAYTAPVAYQTINQQRIDVPVRYVLGKGKQHSYQFALGEYDRSAPLVIDPLIQSTYLGGNNYDQANALVVADGDVLVAGWTSSTNFPGTNGGAQAAHAADGGGRDAFVSRLSGDLKTLRQSTYLGGSGDDYAYPLAVDSTTGDVLVAGYTTSTDFPGASSGAQTASGGGSYDVFVSRLSGDLKTLVQSTYLGGSNDEFTAALAVASNGDVLVAGYARSTDFPGTSDGAQAAHAADGGGYDGFVSRLSGDLKTLRQSTYLGGSSDDYVYALAVDSTTGDALVAGYTYSSDFPNTSGGAQTASGGGYDGFVSRLSGDLKTLQQSTYLGGSGSDQANALVVADGDVLVAGYTYSIDFPNTSGGAQAAHAADGGGNDAFVARLSGDLQTLRQSTYLGGSGNDFAYPLAVDSTTGDVLVAGYTYSTNFPGTSGGTQAAHGGGSIDAFVSRLSGDLKTLVQSTYLGGSHDDFARSVAVASNGDVLVAGGTLSTNFPGTSAGAQAASGGGNDAFVARLSGDLKAVSPQAITFGVQPSQTFASGGTFVLNPVATASSDLPVSYTSITPAVCTISGTTVTMASAGTCTIQAGQAGNASWQAATPVTQSITITQGSQTITFGPQPSQTYTSGGTFALNPAATASSGLSVSYTSTTPAVCTISGTTVTMLSVGACTITASQAGNASWQAATPVSQSITINQGTQAINFGAQPSQTYASGGTFTLNPVATASSGLPVSYTSATPTVCSISGTTVTMLSAGTCTITASQAGNASWQAAAPVSQSVNVTVPVPTPVPANAPWALLLATLGVAGLMASGLRVRRQGHLGQCLRGDR